MNIIQEWETFVGEDKDYFYFHGGKDVKFIEGDMTLSFGRWILFNHFEIGCEDKNIIFRRSKNSEKHYVYFFNDKERKKSNDEYLDDVCNNWQRVGTPGTVMYEGILYRRAVH